jgi:hypothetical protein
MLEICRSSQLSTLNDQPSVFPPSSHCSRKLSEFLILTFFVWGAQAASLLVSAASRNELLLDRPKDS